MRELRQLVSFRRVFHRLPGILLACNVISFAVMHRGGSVRVRRHLMKFRRSLM